MLTTSLKSIAGKIRFLPLFLFLANVSMVVFFLKFGSRGLDTTDESHYFLAVSNPWLYKTLTSQYLYVYEILFNLLGQSMVLLKVANALIVIALACTASVLVFKKAFSSGCLSRTEHWLVSFVVVLVCLVSFIHAILAPSYNSLCISGIFVTVISLMISKDEERMSWGGWILLGVGGWLTGMGRPTSALLLGVLCLAYLLFTRRCRVAGLLVSIAAFLLLYIATMLYVAGGIGQFVSEMLLGYEQARMFGAGYGVWESFLHMFDADVYKYAFTLRFAGFILLAYSFTMASFSRARSVKWIAGFITFALITAALISGTGGRIAFFERAMVSSNPYSRFIYGIAIPLGMFVALLHTYKFPILNDEKRKFLVFALFLLFMPFVYTYGTGVYMNFFLPRTVVFWIMGLFAAAITLYREHVRFGTVFGVLCLLFAFTAGQVKYDQMHPFRQKQPLPLQSKMIFSPATGAGLVVDDDVHAYITALQNMAFGAGFKTGEPLLDMTGRMPAAALFLGAEAPGVIQFSSGYPGSRNRTKHVLTTLIDKSVIDRAWLLMMEEPKEMEYDAAFLEECGIFVERDYENVGTIQAPTYTRDDVPRRHVLLKPVQKVQGM